MSTLNNEKGAALLTAIGFLLIVLLLAAVVNKISLSEMVLSRSEASHKKAFVMAEDGCRDAIAWLTSQATPPEIGFSKIKGNSAFYPNARSYTGTSPNFTPPTTAAGWSPYVYRDRFRYRYYIEHLPSDFASTTEQASSTKIGAKYDSSAGNKYRMYRITSVGSTADGTVKKCIELNYAVKY